ncbi:MAG TPA: hypothetical protein VGN63_10835 [Flavisolibacter sp.]|jgi:hypothetical protein|nr:hypothetical protein [Flavisolibacter sp.]
MKKIFFMAAVLFLSTALYSFRQLQTTYNNIFNQLGIETEVAETYIVDNIIGGSTSFPTSEIMVSLALNKREEAVRKIGDYIKAYVQTPAFAKEYATARTDQKPEAPTGLYKNAENMAVYKEDMLRWEKEYPASFTVLLKRKLNEFLQLTADIDFNAKLVQRGKKQVFADPALEAKDSFWKACFRSGKTTVAAARSYAQQWLLELH